MSSASVAVTRPRRSRTWLYARAEYVRKKNVADAHRRDHGQRREREPPVEEEEKHGGADQRQRVPDQAGDAVGDELVECLDVVRQPADDHARSGSLVVAEREPLEVPEELRPQVGEHPLPDPARQVGLRVGHSPVREPGDQERGDDEVEMSAVVRVDRVVEGVLREQRRRERGHRRGQQRDQREDRPPPVGRCEPVQRPEPPPRLRPRPVAHLRIALLEQMAPGLVDPHATSSIAARASTASANRRSSSPWS